MSPSGDRMQTPVPLFACPLSSPSLLSSLITLGEKVFYVSIKFIICVYVNVLEVKSNYKDKCFQLTGDYTYIGSFIVELSKMEKKTFINKKAVIHIHETEGEFKKALETKQMFTKSMERCKQMWLHSRWCRLRRRKWDFCQLINFYHCLILCVHSYHPAPLSCAETETFQSLFYLLNFLQKSNNVRP